MLSEQITNVTGILFTKWFEKTDSAKGEKSGRSLYHTIRMGLSRGFRSVE